MSRDESYAEGEIGGSSGSNSTGTYIGTQPPQQTSYPGAAQTQNSATRAENIAKRQECNLTGGFFGGGECYKGEDAVAYIANLGPNAPAYDRAQDWLEEYNNEQDILADSTNEEDPFDVDGEDIFDEIGAYAIDTDGDGFVDTVVRDNYIEVAGENGIETQIETVRVNGNAELDAEVQAAQDLKDSIYNQEGWDDLEPWEQDQQLINAGGTAINGTDGNPPEETEETEETLLDDVTSTVQEGIDKIKEEFPTWEELWGNIKDSLPSDPKEWGGAIRDVLTSIGVDLPSGDIWEILNGGYGVIATGGGSIFNPANQNIFIPGIPVGLPPSSTVIGTVEDLINDPVGTLVNKVKDVFGDVVSDPGGFVQGILEGTLDVPSSVWSVLVGGVAATQDVYDWVKETIGSSEEETIVGGEEEEEEPEKEVPKTNLVGESEDFGTQPTDETKEEVVEEEVANNEEAVENYRTNQVIDLLGSTIASIPEQQEETLEQGLTFGGESQVFEQGEIGPREQQVINMFGNMFTAAGGDDQVEEQIENQVEEQIENQVEEQVEDNPFTFGGEGMIVEDTLTSDLPYTITEDPDQEEEVEDVFTVTPPVSSGSSASSARRQGMFDPVQYGITYQTPTVQALIQSPQTDYMAPLNQIINKGMLV